MRLNKDIYEDSHKSTYYGEFTISDIKLVKCIPVKNQIDKLTVHFKEYICDDTLDLRYYTKLKTLTLKYLKTDGGSDSKVKSIIYPPNLKKIILEDVDIKFSAIPNTVESLIIDAQYTFSERTLENCCKHLKYLKLEDVSIDTLDLSKFTVLEALHLGNIIFKISYALPPNIKELYMNNIIYEKYESSNNQTYSFKMNQKLELLVVYWYGEKSYLTFIDIPNTLKVFISGYDDNIIYKNIPRKLLLYSYLQSSDIDAVFNVNYMNFDIFKHYKYQKYIIYGNDDHCVLLYKSDIDFYKEYQKLKRYYWLKPYFVYKIIKECAKR